MPFAAILPQDDPRRADALFALFARFAVSLSVA
jgi:hypothetical protein